MYYDVSFTIPANTAELSPSLKYVKLCYGVIHRVEAGFPRGCAGLAHLQIKRASHQLWPTNPEGSFNTDGYTISFNEDQDFFIEPYILTLVGWNLDDTYDHTLEVRIGVYQVRAPRPEGPITLAVRRLSGRFGL